MSRLEAVLREIEAEQGEVNAELQRLTRRAEHLQQVATGIRGLLTEQTGLATLPPVTTVTVMSNSSKHTRHSLSDAVLAVLSQDDNPMTVRQVKDALVRGELVDLSRYRDPDSAIYMSLRRLVDRDNRAIRVDGAYTAMLDVRHGDSSEGDEPTTYSS